MKASSIYHLPFTVYHLQLPIVSAILKITEASGKSWEINLTAVLEEQDGTKSYWALAHPPEKPDFHMPDCFIGKLG